MSENENIEKAGLSSAAEPAETPKVPAKTEKTGKSKKSKPETKKAKPGFFARLSRWFREMKSELKKVQWPDVKQTLNSTWTVLLCVVFVGIFIWAYDFLANNIIDALLSIFKG